MKKSIFIAVFAAFFITSCGPKVVGTWNIDRYEVKNQQGRDYTARNAGEIEIRKNGTGERRLDYTVFRSREADTEAFSWTKTDDYITIRGTDGSEDSEFNKTWIMMTNKRKKQLWKSTDGSNTVQILEMSKK